MSRMFKNVIIFSSGFCFSVVLRNLSAPVTTYTINEYYSYQDAVNNDNNRSIPKPPSQDSDPSLLGDMSNYRSFANNSHSSSTNQKALVQDTNTDDYRLGNATEYLWNGKKLYFQAAFSSKPVTDKVTTHTYQIMYGRFLLPYYHQNPTMKFLEIGLGCDMGYGPGASVGIYQKLFPRAELWEAEFDAACVEKHRDGLLKGIHLLVGDQGNDTILDGWIEQSGGNFDVVIDDGGHQNCQIWHSFQKLWPTVKPGGLYFIEDMQVAQWEVYRNATTDTCNTDLIVPNKLKEYIDDMLYKTSLYGKPDIEFVFCQSEACVIGKKT